MSPGKPPIEPSKTIGDDLIRGKQPMWTKEKERILLGPFDFLYGHPGKDIRAQTIDAFNQWLKVPEDRLAIITRAVGMLHTASLL
jgi:geranylgeranyl diphosphate synthase type 3